MKTVLSDVTGNTDYTNKRTSLHTDIPYSNHTMFFIIDAGVPFVINNGLHVVVCVGYQLIVYTPKTLIIYDGYSKYKTYKVFDTNMDPDTVRSYSYSRWN